MLTLNDEHAHSTVKNDISNVVIIVRVSSTHSHKKQKKKGLLTSSKSVSTFPEAAIIIDIAAASTRFSGHYSPFHHVYFSIMHDSRGYLLSRKLCQHNSPIPSYGHSIGQPNYSVCMQCAIC